MAHDVSATVTRTAIEHLRRYAATPETELCALAGRAEEGVGDPALVSAQVHALIGDALDGPAGDGATIVAGGQVADAQDADRTQLASYARAMDDVGTMAIDPHLRWSDRVILDLQVRRVRLSARPLPRALAHRPGPHHEPSPSGGPPAYTGPNADAVPTLMVEVIHRLHDKDLDAHDNCLLPSHSQRSLSVRWQ